MNLKSTKKRLRKDGGSLTVEASFVFPWLIIVIVLFLRLDFRLHDRMLSEVCDTLGELRLEQAKDCFYDSDWGDFREEWLLTGSVLGQDCAWLTKEEAEIAARQVRYFHAHRIRTSSAYAPRQAEYRMAQKNAELLRKGARALQIIKEEQ